MAKKYKTLTEKWAAEDAAKAAAKRKANPAPAPAAKKSGGGIFDLMRNRKNNLDKAIKDAGASRKKSSKKYT
jgi:hypothetical protein